MSARVRAAARTRSRPRGFSLIELLVVVIIVGIVAALAIPTMSVARFDRAAYSDAGSVMQLFREARTHAIARGGAVLVSMTANGTSDRGTFQLWEAVTTNASGGGPQQTPVASCKSPTNWTPLVTTNPKLLFLDSINLNGAGSSVEVDADIETQLYVYSGTNQTAFNVGYMCWTPLGHSFFFNGAATPTMFDASLPTLSPLEVRVVRAVNGGAGAAGTIRSVLIPPNGMARLFSHV